MRKYSLFCNSNESLNNSIFLNIRKSLVKVPYNTVVSESQETLCKIVHALVYFQIYIVLIFFLQASRQLCKMQERYISD